MNKKNDQWSLMAKRTKANRTFAKKISENKISQA
jgi:hypothetical protein